MPIYEYEPIAESCEYCRRGFQAIQTLAEPELKSCPRCGKPCRKLFSSFASTRGVRDLLSPKNLERHGFTQYKRSQDGTYEKTAGAGPRGIDPR